MARGEKKEKKHRSTSVFSVLLILVLMGAFLWQMRQLQEQVTAARAQKEALIVEVAQKKQANESLRNDIEEGPTVEQMEQIAREELGLTLSGEKVFYDVSN